MDFEERLNELSDCHRNSLGRVAGKAYEDGYEQGLKANGEAIAEARKDAFDDGYRQGREQAMNEHGQKMPELPRPCDGPLYDGWDEDDYFSKVAEEVGEVAKALRQWLMHPDHDEEHRDHLFLECADAITAIVSLMHVAGCDSAEKRAEYFRRVNESNAKRDGGRRFRA